MLGNHDLGPAFIEVIDDDVTVEGLVGDERIKADALEKRLDADGVVAMPRQQLEAHQIAQSIRQGEDFGGHAPFRAPYGLALSPPFAPWPWWWTLTMVASTMAYSMSGSSEHASKIRAKTSAFTQSRYRLKTVFQRAGHRSEEHTSELQSRPHLVCRLLLEKKK